jgi:hypothetical protein
MHDELCQLASPLINILLVSIDDDGFIVVSEVSTFLPWFYSVFARSMAQPIIQPAHAHEWMDETRCTHTHKGIIKAAMPSIDIDIFLMAYCSVRLDPNSN